jgi:hypothetical protein
MIVSIENKATFKTRCVSRQLVELGLGDGLVSSLGVGAGVAVFFSRGVPVTLSFLPCRQTSNELRITSRRDCLYRLIMYAAV